MNRYASLLALVVASCFGFANTLGLTKTQGEEPLPGTRLLTETRPLDEVMVEGIDRFALSEIEQAAQTRESLWNLDYSSRSSYEKSLKPYRRHFSELIGVVDERVAPRGIERIATVDGGSLVAENEQFEVVLVRWPTLEGMDAEGLFLRPKSEPIGRVVAIPDADWTPEMISGLSEGPTRFAADFAALGCEVLIPTLVSRDHRYSGNPSIGKTTNLTHREFVYRQAFELGRHVIGFEVQKVLAAVDQFALRNEQGKDLPIGVVGVSEGGLLALYSGALDPRIDAVVVSGYFDRREKVWAEPIYRNVWGLLTHFGDAELAGMVAPRFLYLEENIAIPQVLEAPSGDRNIAAPGQILRPDPNSVSFEAKRAGMHWAKMVHWDDRGIGGVHHSPPDKTGETPLDTPTVRHLVSHMTGGDAPLLATLPIKHERQTLPAVELRQQRQVEQMSRFTRRLLQQSHRTREQLWNTMDRSSVESWNRDAQAMRQKIHAELIGRLPDPTVEPDPRTRKILEEADYVGYDVVLNVYPDVIASGILLLPKNLLPGERRPVVVCQHGLEGTPMDTIEGPSSNGYRAYKSFSVELVKRGFIVYAPQNPYRGGDAFRAIQRKSNPLGRSLFSYIIPQHLVTLRWLAGLPQVDTARIGFYGLSYGGKTAMRVPPLLPPTDTEPGYALSICSADFNEWVAKNASIDAPFSYVWTPEYEIFEWNMGHLANYAELAALMSPRPFMVERGHDDGVGIDEWVAWEYAKVRRHYAKLGIPNQTEIEFFNGPHTIHGVGTFRFLRQHLNWPE